MVWKFLKIIVLHSIYETTIHPHSLKSIPFFLWKKTQGQRFLHNFITYFVTGKPCKDDTEIMNLVLISCTKWTVALLFVKQFSIFLKDSRCHSFSSKYRLFSFCLKCWALFMVRLWTDLIAPLFLLPYSCLFICACPWASVSVQVKRSMGYSKFF